MIALTVTLALQAVAQAANDPVGEVRATIADASPISQNNSLSPEQREQQLRAVAAKHFDFA